MYVCIQEKFEDTKGVIKR